ncbi:hypothetical protein DPMN_167933 [Dreissena polymorpha]|uniref:Uncharacterized protein n=1 Tax=Dreissena polymorpha TaxID=45954 RepID=A0A9D4F460_DREPO|nr:hypothetical protein DPMN_167933 [Dreissena polymorpha]
MTSGQYVSSSMGNVCDTPVPRLNYQDVCNQLDYLNRELEEMMTSIFKMSERAHVIEVEMATLYNPEVEHALRNGQLECGACTQALEELKTIN